MIVSANEPHTPNLSSGEPECHCEPAASSEHTLETNEPHTPNLSSSEPEGHCEPAANNLFIVEQTVETWSNVHSKQFSSLYDQTSCEKISDVLCATKPLHTDGI